MQRNKFSSHSIAYVTNKVPLPCLLELPYLKEDLENKTFCSAFILIEIGRGHKEPFVVSQPRPYHCFSSVKVEVINQAKSSTIFSWFLL